MNDNFNISLNEQQTNIVLQALQELPYRVSREVIDSIIGQLREAAQPQSEQVVEDDE